MENIREKLLHIIIMMMSEDLFRIKQFVFYVLQEWSFSEDGSLRHLDLCIVLPSNTAGTVLELAHCTPTHHSMVSDISYRISDLSKHIWI